MEQQTQRMKIETPCSSSFRKRALNNTMWKCVERDTSLGTRLHVNIDQEAPDGLYNKVDYNKIDYTE